MRYPLLAGVLLHRRVDLITIEEDGEDMQLPKLDNRLTTAVRYVRAGAVVADVGTDHAYLPVYLTATGQARFAVASDINEGPIARAAQHVAEYGLSDKVKTLRADGLAGLEAYAPTDIIIFGMGGELIARILSDAPWVRDAGIRLILQPMTHAESVRTYLSEQGFAIIDETLSREGGKIYQTIVAEFDGKTRTVDTLTAEIGRFARPCDGETETLRTLFLRHRIEVLSAAAAGKERAGVDTEAERRLIAQMEECL